MIVYSARSNIKVGNIFEPLFFLHEKIVNVQHSDNLLFLTPPNDINVKPLNGTIARTSVILYNKKVTRSNFWYYILFLSQ